MEESIFVDGEILCTHARARAFNGCVWSGPRLYAARTTTTCARAHSYESTHAYTVYTYYSLYSLKNTMIAKISLKNAL